MPANKTMLFTTYVRQFVRLLEYRCTPYTLGFLRGGSCKLNFGMSHEEANGIRLGDIFFPIVSICRGGGNGTS